MSLQTLPDLPDAGKQPQTAPENHNSLGLIFFIMLMDIIGITILSPVAPQIIMRYSTSALMVNMVPVIYSIGQFIATPFIGKLGDRFGRRPVLLVSLLGQALGYFIFAWGGSLTILFLGRLVGGITGGNLSTASAYIADVSKPGERSKNFAIISSAWSLGLILGPALGGLFGQFFLEAPAYVAAGITCVTVLLSIFLLPESLPVEKRVTTQIRLRDFNPIISIVDMARKPGLGALLVVSALFGFAFNGINSTAALFIIQKFSAQTWQVSFMLIMAGVFITFTNFFLVPRWVPRFGEKISAVAGLLGSALLNVVMFFAPFLGSFFVINTLASGTSAFIFPALTSLTAERVSPREMGELMGVTSAVGSLMNIFGPIASGLVYDHVMMGSPFWMGAIILTFTAYMLNRTVTNLQHQGTPAETEY